MNKRKFKKFKKKNYNKTYAAYRYERILNIADSMTSDEIDKLIYLVTSRKSMKNYKHIIELKAFSNIKLQSASNHDTVDIKFKCNQHINNEKLNSVSEMYKKWIGGLQEVTDKESKDENN